MDKRELNAQIELDRAEKEFVKFKDSALLFCNIIEAMFRKFNIHLSYKRQNRQTFEITSEG